MAKIANKYAKALFDTAVDHESLETMYESFSTIDYAVYPETAKLKALDEDPQKDAEQRIRFVTLVFGETEHYLLNMLKILAYNRHLSYIHEIFKSFEAFYNSHHKQDFAVVESVYALTEEDLTSIEEIIKKRTHLETVMLSNKINPELIGGVRIKVGTKVMDASVQNDLAQLEKQFIRVK
ncbi:F0F1 ATP synthase subunit delta [Staphylococcus sp. ACRSN]|uniref:F0F1 ATP synthase subunit delta n=1 Tax=Staphylococcus sp. ACRSN TaxID=2918214 RepID=UPI001EF398F3|nr:F0F1 ATP synthase subunit delta [Staphylococcus sp. ACRSN]MCG7340012.1 F0F1 ATP synthase subunit delta [Staphylococcus sp. ACRSN]